MFSLIMISDVGIGHKYCRSSHLRWESTWIKPSFSIAEKSAIPSSSICGVVGQNHSPFDVTLSLEVTKIVYFIGNEHMLIAHDSNRLRFS